MLQSLSEQELELFYESNKLDMGIYQKAEQAFNEFKKEILKK